MRTDARTCGPSCTVFVLPRTGARAEHKRRVNNAGASWRVCARAAVCERSRGNLSARTSVSVILIKNAEKPILAVVLDPPLPLPYALW